MNIVSYFPIQLFLCEINKPQSKHVRPRNERGSFPQMRFVEFSEFKESWQNPKVAWLPEIAHIWQ